LSMCKILFLCDAYLLCHCEEYIAHVSSLLSYWEMDWIVSFLWKQYCFPVESLHDGTDQISVLVGSLRLAYSPVRPVFIIRCLQAVDQPESLCAAQRQPWCCFSSCKGT
jgi:hypothetical protein